MGFGGELLHNGCCGGPKWVFNISVEFEHFQEMEVGGRDRAQPRKQFVSFRSCGRACVRAVWLPSGIRSAKTPPTFPFSLLAELSLYPCVSAGFFLFWIELSSKRNRYEKRESEENELNPK